MERGAPPAPGSSRGREADSWERRIAATDQAAMSAKPRDIISCHHTSYHISAGERAALGRLQADILFAKLFQA